MTESRPPRHVIHHGDTLHILPTLPDGSVDAIVTDPPYGLEFMGKDWDKFGATSAKFREPTTADEGFRVRRGSLPDAYVAGQGFQTWCQLWAAEALRVLKPGGHLVAFGGTRTYHRMTCAIEDAGFEVRDSLMWLYGSGFPKSHNIGKAIDKAAGATREVVGKSARHVSGKPGQRTAGLNGSGTFSETVGMGGTITAPATPEAAQWDGWGTALKPAYEPIVLARKPLVGTVAANVLQFGTGGLNVDGCRIESGADYHDLNVTQGGDHFSIGSDAKTRGTTFAPAAGRWPANVTLDPHAAAMLDQQSGVSVSRQGDPNRAGTRTTDHTFGSDTTGFNAAVGPEYSDMGGASRFYYTAKASKKERPVVDGVAHPTVKPIALMRWLCRLTCPPGGLILDPFAGSGTTLEAALIEGFRVVGIEREADYLPLIQARIDRATTTDNDEEGGLW